MAIEEQEVAGLQARGVRDLLRPRQDDPARSDRQGPHRRACARWPRPRRRPRRSTTLKGRARVKRTMWSRRAQEYEAKINSGDLISIAEVVRDLHRAETSPSSPIPSASSMKRRSTAWPAKSAAVNRLHEGEALKLIEGAVRQVAQARQGRRCRVEPEDERGRAGRGRLTTSTFH